MEFHERLKQLREENKLTQKKLGAVLNYGSSAIANYESGRNQPSIPDLKKMSRYFDVTLDYLMGEADTPKPPRLLLTPEEIEQLGNALANQFYAQEKTFTDILRPTIQNLLRECAYLEKKFE